MSYIYEGCLLFLAFIGNIVQGMLFVEIQRISISTVIFK